MIIAFASFEQSHEFGFCLDILPGSQLLNRSRRSTRVATLDGGAALIDNGYAAADRTMTVQFLPDIPAATLDTLQRLVNTVSRVRVFTAEGAFIAHPKSITASGLSLEILAQEA